MQYTPEQKAETLESYREVGASQAARDNGIPLRTVFSWASDAGLTSYAEDEKKRAERLTAKREAIRELLLDRILDMLTTETVKPSDARFNATAVGIFIDKYRLEAGEATTRNEQMGESEIDRAIRRGLDELERAEQSKHALRALESDTPPSSDTT